jgi:hypothetical protein
MLFSLVCIKRLYEEAEKAEPVKAPPVWELRPEYLERIERADEEDRKKEDQATSEIDGWWL